MRYCVQRMSEKMAAKTALEREKAAAELSRYLEENGAPSSTCVYSGKCELEFLARRLDPYIARLSFAFRDAAQLSRG